MSQVAEKPRTMAFASAFERRPQGGPRWLEDLRARGAARFAALGLPTVRDEEWQFLFMYLREFADPNGVLPASFDGLVRESFSELISSRR